MKTGEVKYFLAIVPPSPVYEEAWKVKEYFRDNYHCKAPLRSPPHITLHMPFLWKEQKENKLIGLLGEVANEQKPFEVVLDGFGAFPPRVIYIKIKESQALSDFQKKLTKLTKRKLQLFNSSHKDQPYHPHMTVAFRDLKKPFFLQAWKEFEAKSFTGTFEVDHFCLLKHDGKRWHVHYQFVWQQ